jgi:hypothetical protein
VELLNDPSASCVSEFAIICAKQLSGREIIEAKLPEQGGESRWKPRGDGRNDLDALPGDTQSHL